MVPPTLTEKPCTMLALPTPATPQLLGAIRRPRTLVTAIVLTAGGTGIRAVSGKHPMLFELVPETHRCVPLPAPMTSASRRRLKPVRAVVPALVTTMGPPAVQLTVNVMTFAEPATARGT